MFERSKRLPLALMLESHLDSLAKELTVGGLFPAKAAENAGKRLDKLEHVILPFPLFTEYHLLSYVTMAAMTVMTLWSGIDYLKTYWKFLDPQK